MTRPQLITDHGILTDHGGQPTRTWNRSYGMYIAGRAYVDEADQTAAQMDAKWGVDRLRRLVSPELREKFDRQRYKLNQAIWHGDLEQVRIEAGRMVKAYVALDKAAVLAGAAKLEARVQEVALADGSVAAIVPDDDHARLVQAEGRAVSVYTLAEIARLIDGYPGLAKILQAKPGAKVVAVRRPDDPLQAIDDTGRDIDAPLADDEIPF